MNSCLRKQTIDTTSAPHADQLQTESQLSSNVGFPYEKPSPLSPANSTTNGAESLPSTAEATHSSLVSGAAHVEKEAPDQRTSGVKVRDLHDVIICKLCRGYIIDATSIIGCLHTCE